MSATRSSTGVIALAAASWGLVPLLLRRAGQVHVIAEAVVVMAAIAVGAFPLMWSERRSRRTSAPARGLLLLALAEAANVVCLFRAYQSTTVAVATLTHNLAPVVVAIVAPLILRELPSARAVVATLVGLVGLALVLEPRAGAPALGGALFGAASAGFFALTIVMNKRLSTRLSAGELLCLRAGLVAILLLPFVPRIAWSQLTVRAVAWLVVAGLGPGVAGGLLFLWGLRRAPANHAAPLTLLEPLVAIASASFVLGEPLRPTVIAGALLLLASTVSVITSPSESLIRRESS